MKEGIRCAWLAMLQNRMERNDQTYKDYHSYLHAIKSCDPNNGENEYNDLVIDMFRPLFLTLIASPIPRLGLFEEEDIDKELNITMQTCWNMNFDMKPGTIIKVPLFKQNMYNAWWEYVLPTIKLDL